MKQILIIAIIMVASATAFAQKANVVDAKQSGSWSVGIDPVKNVVKVENASTDPLAVKVVPTESSRKRFQLRTSVGPTANGNDISNVTIPAGKRMVIENISAVARIPEGFKVEAAFFTYFDSNGDGVGDIQDITFHRIPFVDQGAFSGTQILAANHKVHVFADELIGQSHFPLGLQARLNGIAPAGAFVQIQVTFSGYLEDLPAQ